MKIKCYFCQQETQEEAAALTSFLYFSICPSCPNICTTVAGKDDISTTRTASIRFEYKGWDWIATFYIENNSFGVRRMGKSYGDNTFVPTLLLELPFVPTNITPHNIISKMLTLITFS
jgi:hypothetical protein